MDKVVKLQNAWTFHFEGPSNHGASKFTPFGDIRTVQDFWRYWNNVQIDALPKHSKLIFLKHGIAPDLTDPRVNKKGGSWILTRKSEDAFSTWLKCILVLIGEQCTHSDGLLGTSISIKPRNACIISIYNKSSEQTLVIEKSERELNQLLELAKGERCLRYQPNLQDDEKGASIKIGDNDDSFSSPFIQLGKDYNANGDKTDKAEKSETKSDAKEAESKPASTEPTPVITTEPPRDEMSSVHRRSQSEGKLNVNCIVQSDRQDAVNEVLNRRKRAHRSLDESYKKKVISTDKNADKALLPKRHVRKNPSIGTKRASIDVDSDCNSLDAENTELKEDRTTIIYSTPYRRQDQGGRKRWVLVGIVLGLVICLVVHVLLATDLIPGLQRLLRNYAAKYT